VAILAAILAAIPEAIPEAATSAGTRIQSSGANPAGLCPSYKDRSASTTTS
jgi:hypothetical protein